jgi:hypothetical protein
VGGLIVSQALTLFTTPVTYIYMDKINNFLSKKVAKRGAAQAGPGADQSHQEEAA